jgi:exopolysaccharide biosynthesis polyprenyl glycosylphosphotransferase
MLKYPSYKFYYAITDFLVLLLSFLITGYLIRYFTPAHRISFNYFSLNAFIYYFIASVTFIFIFQYYNLYKMNIFLTRAVHLVQILKSLLIGIILLMVYTFLLKLPFIPEFRRSFVLFFYLTSVVLLIIIRIYFLQILSSKFLNKNLLNRNIIIIGAGKSGKLFAEKLIFENSIGITILGFVDDNIKKGAIVFKNFINLGKTFELNSIVKEHKVDEFIISIDKIDYNNLMILIDNCTSVGVNVKISSSLFSIIPDKIFIEEYNNIPVIDVSCKINNQLALIIKRLFDFTVTLFLITISLPFLIIIIVLIRLTSKGPAIFSQTRIGKNGKAFNFYKFRTMNLIDKEDEIRKEMMLEFMKGNHKNIDNPSKIINEKRLTRIGKILRKTSLDELPQLFNVIKGDMSLVGPRPSLPYEYDNYDEWQKRRHSILPGCTGVWQVTGRSNVSFKDSIILDLFYIKNMTPWLDLQLIFKTIPVMLLAKGGK